MNRARTSSSDGVATLADVASPFAAVALIDGAGRGDALVTSRDGAEALGGGLSGAGSFSLDVAPMGRSGGGAGALDAAGRIAPRSSRVSRSSSDS